MNCLDFIIQELGSNIKKSLYFESPTSSPKGVLIIDPAINQPEGFIYVGDEKTVSNECEKGYLSSDSIIFISNYDKSEKEIDLLNNYHNLFFTTLNISKLCNILNIALAKYNEIEDKNGQVVFSTFLHDLISGSTFTEEYVANTKKNLTNNIYQHFNFIVVKFNNQNTLSVCNFRIMRELEQLFSDYNYSIVAGQIVIVYSQPELYSKLPNDLEKTLENFAEKYDCKIGIGSPFRDYNYVRTNFFIINYMLSIVSKIYFKDSPTRLYYEENYAIYTIIDLCKQQFINQFEYNDLLYLAHPGLIRLFDFDKEHNTVYGDFLLEYLMCNGNLSKAAANKYIHRNTAINWLHNITEIIDDDLEDADIRFRLLFSYKLIYYDKFCNDSN